MLSEKLLFALYLGKYSRLSYGHVRKDQGELACDQYKWFMVDQSMLDPVRVSIRLQSVLLQKYFKPQCKTESVRSSNAARPDLEVSPDELVSHNKLAKSLAMFTVGQLCSKFMHILTATSISGRDKFVAALDRPVGTPMISMCNHVCAMDDPIVLGAIVPTSYLLQEERIRWTLCASDRCYKYPALTPLFRAFKTIPVDRGRGLFQAGMRAAVQRLDQGDWVHVFPEGTRTRDGSLGPTRQGVAMLIAECEKDPLVIPFVHSGMEHVMPRKTVLPRPGKKVNILVGDPISFADLRDQRRSGQLSQQQLYDLIQARVHYHMHCLHAQLFNYEPPPPPTCAPISPAPQSPLQRHLSSFPEAMLPRAIWPLLRAYGPSRWREGQWSLRDVWRESQGGTWGQTQWDTYSALWGQPAPSKAGLHVG